MKKTKIAPGFWRFTDGQNTVIVERVADRHGSTEFLAYDAAGRRGRVGYIPWDVRKSYQEAAARGLAVLAAHDDAEQHASECAALARLAIGHPDFATEQGFRTLASGIPSYRCAQIFNRCASGVDFRGCKKAWLQRTWAGLESYPSRVDRNTAVIALIAEQGRPDSWRDVLARLDDRRPLPRKPMLYTHDAVRYRDMKARRKLYTELNERIAAAEKAA